MSESELDFQRAVELSITTETTAKDPLQLRSMEFAILPISLGRGFPGHPVLRIKEITLGPVSDAEGSTFLTSVISGRRSVIAAT